MNKKTFHNWIITIIACIGFIACIPTTKIDSVKGARELISLNKGWSFYKYDSMEQADTLTYDIRPEVEDKNDNKVADSKPTEAIDIETKQFVLKPWIMPTGNRFIKDENKRYIRPAGNPGQDFPFVQSDFNDSDWRIVNLPHDWGIETPFLEGWDAEVGGGMGRLASHGTAWYRKKIDIDSIDAGKSFFLDIDGAMSYTMVWCNGSIVGGWPYGYNSWRVDLTPYLKIGKQNQLAIRLENPPYSARWYPGGGLYRNVWLVKTNPVHVSEYGTFVTTSDVSSASATIHMAVNVDNDSQNTQKIDIITELYLLDKDGYKHISPVAKFPAITQEVKAGQTIKAESSIVFKHPSLWGPPPTQTPNLYMAVTKIIQDDKIIDDYSTRFGIRNVEFDANKGLIVNGEPIKIKGVNQHHDLGALGAAFNYSAAERQLTELKELGCNAIRMSHNPPAPELLELTDKMGFLVMDEIFDCWERKKTPWDFHLIFKDWYEQDTRAYIRRDRNCPSIIIWSYGNEVGEQYTDKDGAAIAQKLHDIIKEEDPTRPTTASMNWAKPDMPFSEVMDVISLNYQGEGIRDAEAYSHLKGIHTSPLYPAFRDKYPDKMIVSSETASALSTRGTYLFPVYDGNSAPAKDGKGADPQTQYVSSYELYTAAFGASADKVFASQDKHPYVAGEFVWTGWDYIGEPTPYYLSRSSYSGIIDLAGFKKDRFYLYQSRWRPDLPMVHILPHWNWPDRIGKITPVHVFTSGDEAELFLNGKSMGKKKKAEYDYRLRWDNVKYEPGELKVVTYKEGKEWATETIKTTKQPALLEASANKTTIKADGLDLAFITVKVCDEDELFIANASNNISFTIEGPGEIVATDNGDPSDMNIFSSHERKAFSGLALVIVKAKEEETGTIKVKISSDGLTDSEILIKTE